MSLGKIFFHSINSIRERPLTSHICRWFKDISSRDSWVSTQEEVKN